MHGLSDADLALQAVARGFADELIPLEVDAELAGGKLPTGVRESHAERARALGLTATNIPVEHGGPCRMITPKLYAWKGAKWIRRIDFLDHDQLGFWETRGYSNTAEPWFEDRYA